MANTDIAATLADLEARLTQDQALSAAQQAQLLRYAAMLLQTNEQVNLTRITSAQGIYEDIISDALAMLPLLDEAKAFYQGTAPWHVLDLGTGAGIPGLILKIMRPAWQFTLLDAAQKKLRFCDRVIADLGLAGISTLHGRAEDVGRQRDLREGFAVVVSRAVGELAVVAEYCLPLVSEGGVFLCPKTRREDLDAAEPAIVELGGTVLDYYPYEVASFVQPGSTVPGDRVLVFVHKLQATPSRYPRAPKQVREQPLR